MELNTKWEDYAKDCPWRYGVWWYGCEAIDRECREEHCAPYRFITRKAEAEPKYGCHCDLEPHMKPDGCVIDEKRYHDCFYAKDGMRKEQCQYWRVVEDSDE